MLTYPPWPRPGIEILRWKELTDPEQASIHQLFKERIYPVLTPLVVDPSHPFPYISNLSLSLAVMIADPATRGDPVRPGQGAAAAAPVPKRVGPNRFVPLEDVIAAHLGDLFVGMDVLEHHAFRITRIRDLEIDEDVTENLLQSLEKELDAAPVRAGRSGSRSRRSMSEGRARPAGHRARGGRAGCLPAAGAAGPVRPVRPSPTWTCGT